MQLNSLKNDIQIRKMETAAGGPIKKRIKRLKDGYRYIPDERNGGWNRISDNEMSDVFATYIVEGKDKRADVRIDKKSENFDRKFKYDETEIPFIKDKEITLTNAGLYTGAKLSTNLLDSIAKYAKISGLPLKTAVGLVAKETSLGNPTVDSSLKKLAGDGFAYQLAKALNGGLHINEGKALNPKDLINFHYEELNPYLGLKNIAYKKSVGNMGDYGREGPFGDEDFLKRYRELLKLGENYADNLAKKLLSNFNPNKNVLQAGFEFYKLNPRKYNYNQTNYPQLVEERGNMVYNSPEFKSWLSTSEYKKQGGKMNILQFLQKGTPKNGITINKSVPEITVVPNKLYLDTFYPIISNDYPITGHSRIVGLAFTEDGFKEAEIDKLMNDAGYNLVTNNCADATRCVLENISGKKMNPYFFTTPGDVLSFFKKNFDVRKSNLSAFGNPVYYTNISEADFDKIKDLEQQLLSANEKMMLKQSKQLALNKKDGGKMNILEFLKKGGQIRKMLTASGGPIDYKKWDNAKSTAYKIPFIPEKRIKLTNAGLATGAVLSTNLLDSIADNAVRAGLPILTAIGLAVKESTLGNPTDDRSAWNLSSYIRKLFNNTYPGTVLHINKGEVIDPVSLINYYKGDIDYGWRSFPNEFGLEILLPVKNQSVLKTGFEFYKKHPNKYNPGQKNHLQLVEKRGRETMRSPEILKWYKEWEKSRALIFRPEPYKIDTNIQNTALKFIPHKKQGGKINAIKQFKQGGQVRKMLTASGGPIINGGIPFSITVKGKDRRPAWKRMYLNPNLGDTSKYYNGNILEGVIGLAPGIGDAIDAVKAADAVNNKDYTTAGFLGAGLLLPNIIEKPFKFVRGLYKGHKANKIMEVARKAFDESGEKLEVDAFKSGSKPMYVTPAKGPGSNHIDVISDELKDSKYLDLERPFGKDGTLTLRYYINEDKLKQIIGTYKDLYKDRLGLYTNDVDKIYNHIISNPKLLDLNVNPGTSGLLDIIGVSLGYGPKDAILFKIGYNGLNTGEKVSKDAIESMKTYGYDRTLPGIYNILKKNIERGTLGVKSTNTNGGHVGFGYIKNKLGGMLQLLKNGSGIHIKKKNRGKFTSYCGGKVTDECILRGKNSSNPTIRKRATFAANARKWKHKEGGIIKASEGTKTTFGLKILNILGNDTVKTIGSGLFNMFANYNASSSYNNAIDNRIKALEKYKTYNDNLILDWALLKADEELKSLFNLQLLAGMSFENPSSIVFEHKKRLLANNYALKAKSLNDIEYLSKVANLESLKLDLTSGIFNGLINTGISAYANRALNPNGTPSKTTTTLNGATPNNNILKTGYEPYKSGYVDLFGNISTGMGGFKFDKNFNVVNV